jgi:hypothetical protein
MSALRLGTRHAANALLLPRTLVSLGCTCVVQRFRLRQLHSVRLLVPCLSHAFVFSLHVGEEVVLRRRLSALESRRGCLEAAAAVQAGIQGDGSGAGSGGAPSLSEALRLVMGQLRGVLASEEQQLRLLQQQHRSKRRQQQRLGSPSSSRDGAAAAADEQQYGDEYEEYEDGGAEDDAYDVEGDGEAAAEAASSSAGVSALAAALEELEAAQEALGEAQAQVSSRHHHCLFLSLPSLLVMCSGELWWLVKRTAAVLSR